MSFSKNQKKYFEFDWPYTFDLMGMNSTIFLIDECYACEKDNKKYYSTFNVSSHLNMDDKVGAMVSNMF